LSDFRILLSPDREFSDRELDWLEASRRWRLSDKEYGSVTWEFDRNPTEIDLIELRDFFEVSRHFVTLDAIAKLNPGELATIHAQSNDPPRIRATRCEVCDRHWVVYKLSDETWLKYGLKCDNNGWWLGNPVPDDEAISITRA
jgi:hypothetical protein